MKKVKQNVIENPVNKDYDGGKKINGRKRHILVDTQAFLVSTVITAADKNDREGLSKVLQKIKGKYKNLNLIWADMGYLGKRRKPW